MAGSFEATLSVSDRPELTSLAVTAVPIDPPAVERAAAGDGTTDRRDPEHGVGGKGKNNGNEEDASTGARPEKQRKSSEREESVSDDEDQPDDDGLHAAAKKGMNVVGWWRAKLNANHGLDKEILAALHLLAGARGPCMRLAFSHPVLSQPGDSDARRRNKEGLTKLHREMRAEQKSAVMFLDDPATGRRREVHLAPAPRGGIVKEHHRGFLLGAHLPMELGEALLVASASVRVTRLREDRMREGEAHARPARPREEVQGGEDLLIEPVVRVELGSPPTDHVHALLRRRVQPVVVRLVLIVADGFFPLRAFALLLRTRAGGGVLFVSVVFSFSAHPVLGVAAVGRPVTRCRALDRRRIDGDGRYRERCQLGAIAHRQRSLERARHRRRDDAQQRKKLCEPVSSGSARGQNRGFSPNPIWWGWLLAHGGVPSSRCAADSRSSREPDGTRGYRPKPTHGPAPTGARPSRRLPRRLQALSSPPGHRPDGAKVTAQVRMMAPS